MSMKVLDDDGNIRSNLKGMVAYSDRNLISAMTENQVDNPCMQQDSEVLWKE